MSNQCEDILKEHDGENSSPLVYGSALKNAKPISPVTGLTTTIGCAEAAVDWGILSLLGPNALSQKLRKRFSVSQQGTCLVNKTHSLCAHSPAASPMNVVPCERDTDPNGEFQVDQVTAEVLNEMLARLESLANSMATKQDLNSIV